MCHFIMILSNHDSNNLKFCGKIFTSFPLDFCTGNPFKIFDQNFFICQPIFFFFFFFFSLV